MAQESTASRSAAVLEEVLGILSYTRWPVEPAELRLCVIGQVRYADDLMGGATQASGRPVVGRRLPPLSVGIGTGCDIVYLGAMGDADRQRVFSQLSGRPILSISEQDTTCTVGSMFCLQVEPAQISFLVNLDSVARSGVRVSPKVLQLGRRRASQP